MTTPGPPSNPPPGPPPPPQPPNAYGEQPTGGEQPRNGQGLAAMIVGIISLPLACCGIFGVIAGVVAVVLGALGKKKAEQGEATNRGQALAGLICGAIGIVLAIILTIVTFTTGAYDDFTSSLGAR